MGMFHRVAPRPGGVDRPARPDRLERWRGRSGQWLAVIAAVGLGVLKLDAYRAVVHHRAGMMALLGIGLVFSVLRPRPVLFALTASPLVALALHPHPVLLGVGIGFGAFALLMALFFGVAAILHARQAL